MKVLHIECDCAILPKVEVHEATEEREAHRLFHLQREAALRQEGPLYWVIHLNGKHILGWDGCGYCDMLFGRKR